MKHWMGPAILAVGLVAGCAPTLPPELQSARVSYERAAASPNATLVPVQLTDARAWLNRAEREYAETGDTEWSRDIAYIAQRRALVAEADGESARSLAEKQQSIAQLEHLRERREALAMDRSKRPPMTAAERRARSVSNAQILETLAKIQDVKATETDRGLKLVLPGEILFASGQTQLVGDAKDRLHQIAIALKDDPRRLVIVGHTDDRGTEGVNQRISEQRAVEVKKLFEKQGISDDRLEARGVGAAEPMVANDSEKNRATNRRVEIILEE